MIKGFLKIIVIALVLRIILAAISYHSDIQPFDLAGYVIGQGNILNYYDYLPSLPADSEVLAVYPTNLFNYPPAVYFFLGISSLIFTLPIDQGFHHDFLFRVSNTFGNPLIFLHLILLKIPFFIFDFWAAFLFAKLFDDKRAQRWAFILWLFNPVNLYATYLVGQFDVIPTFFSIASLYFLTRNKDSLYKPALMLGLGGAFKIYPLFLLIPLASYYKTWGERIKVILTGVLTYVIIILPFIFSSGFRSTALVAGQTLKSLYAQIPVSGGESILLFLAIIIFFYLMFLSFRASVANLWQRYFIVLILFFSFTHFHPQWFLWMAPFLIIDLIHTNFKNWVAVLLVLSSYLLMILLFDPGLSIGLFAPLNPALYSSQGIFQLLGLNIEINFGRSLAQTAFVGAMLYYLYLYFPRENLNELIKVKKED